MGQDIAIFMATHQEKISENAKFIIPIQVGATLSGAIFQDVTDNDGVNISDKNKSFCELTALYWIWKNTNFSYVGLCHYRRSFDVNVNTIPELLEKYSVLLPKKLHLPLSLEEQYLRVHCEEDWTTMMNVLKHLYPDYYLSIKKVFKNNNILYSYNMFISKYEFLDSYCQWLFPILFEIEKKIDNTKRSSYQARYIGFLSERLLTLYVFHNKISIFELDVICRDTCTERNFIDNFFNMGIYWYRRTKDKFKFKGCESK